MMYIASIYRRIVKCFFFQTGDSRNQSQKLCDNFIFNNFCVSRSEILCVFTAHSCKYVIHVELKILVIPPLSSELCFAMSNEHKYKFAAPRHPYRRLHLSRQFSKWTNTSYTSQSYSTLLYVWFCSKSHLRSRMKIVEEDVR